MVRILGRTPAELARLQLALEHDLTVDGLLVSRPTGEDPALCCLVVLGDGVLPFCCADVPSSIRRELDGLGAAGLDERSRPSLRGSSSWAGSPFDASRPPCSRSPSPATPGRTGRSSADARWCVCRRARRLLLPGGERRVEGARGLVARRAGVRGRDTRAEGRDPRKERDFPAGSPLTAQGRGRYGLPD